LKLPQEPVFVSFAPCSVHRTYVDQMLLSIGYCLMKRLKVSGLLSYTAISILRNCTSDEGMYVNVRIRCGALGQADLPLEISRVNTGSKHSTVLPGSCSVSVQVNCTQHPKNPEEVLGVQYFRDLTKEKSCERRGCRVPTQRNPCPG
jgi:hypothetical protein